MCPNCDSNRVENGTCLDCGYTDPAIEAGPAEGQDQ